MSCLKIGTRQSKLALAQTEIVAAALKKLDSSLSIEVVPILSQGDQLLDRPIEHIGKGVFVKELDEALLSGRVDLCVHSLKDVPTELASGLVVAAIPERECPLDMLLFQPGKSWADLPPGARVGSGSPRRAAQSRALRPDLTFLPIRGNIETRLRKWREGQCEALLLAAAGLKRLNLPELKEARLLPPAEMVPAPGQGALCLLARANSAAAQIAQKLDHQESRLAVEGERWLLSQLGGGCQAPFGALVEIKETRLTIWAALGEAGVSGTRPLCVQMRGNLADREMLLQKTRSSLLSGKS